MATSTIKRSPAVQVLQPVLTSAYTGGWIDDFIGLPALSSNSNEARVVLNVYNQANGTYMTMMKRGGDGKIAFSGNIANGSKISVSGVIM